MAAASALFAGYLAGRAWSLIRRAVRLPHTELWPGFDVALSEAPFRAAPSPSS